MSTVIVASTSSNQAKKIENFTGKTFADLKANSVFQSLFTAGQDVVLNPGNVNLVRDEAELPSGDFRVFLIQSKNKSGAFTYDDADEVATAVSEALDVVVEKQSKDTSVVDDLKKALVGAINNYFSIATTGAECAECDDALATAKELEND